MKNVRKIQILCLAAMAFFVACNKEQMNKAMNGSAQEPNSMIVKMTDNPGDYLGLKMEIERVDAYTNSGWITLNSQAQFIDVAKLTNGNSATIATKTNLQAGNYTKIKIVFGFHNKLTLMADATDGSVLRIAHETNIELDGNNEVIVEIDAEVNAKAGAEILIDFDIVKSVVADTKGYIVKPVIAWIKDEKTAVSGEINAQAAAIILTNGADSVSTYTDLQGRFYLRGMKPGVYTLLITPARKFVTDAMQKTKKIEGVVVIEGEIKYLGKVDLN